MEKKEISEKEKRVRGIAEIYYARKDVQNALYEFAKNREISPRYFEGFGKRPDILQYPNDVFALARNGATSFHCSEEIWSDPLRIETGMNEKKANELRTGWDILIDIDCKWFEYSKRAGQAIVNILKRYDVECVGVKFSGSKGFHIIIPWKAFIPELAERKTKDLFPDLARTVVNFIRVEAEKEMKANLPADFYSQFKDIDIKKGVKCNNCSEIAKSFERVELFCNNCYIGEERRLEVGDTTEFKCPGCRRAFFRKNVEPFYECEKCNITSKTNPGNFSSSVEIDLFELMGLDLVLVSSRHLFRMPYSLHEKTALSSIVIDKDKIMDFEMRDARPENMTVQNFMPDAKVNEAGKLLISALDWESEHKPKDFIKKSQGKFSEYKELELHDVKDAQFPPCVKKILEGLGDGKKRGLFALLHLYRSIGMEKNEMEKRLYFWNEKNDIPLKTGYIKSQLDWAYKRKPLMPPNCKEFYSGLGVCSPDNYCGYIKNPVNYVAKKNFSANKKDWTGPDGASQAKQNDGKSKNKKGKKIKYGIGKPDNYVPLAGETIEKVGGREKEGFMAGEKVEKAGAGKKRQKYGDGVALGHGIVIEKLKRKVKKVEKGKEGGKKEKVEGDNPSQ